MENNPLKNLWQIADLRNRVLFTLGMLGVYRIGNHIPTPGVNQTALALLADAQKNTMFGLYDMFSGGNLSKVTIFALGIMPYISSSIILQLLTVVWPFLERQTEIAGGLPLVYNPGWGFRLLCVLTLTTGTIFIMWLGEQITERGIGNGMSLLIFAGIIVGFPRGSLQTFDQMQTGQISLFRIFFLLVMMVAVIAAIIFVERGHRRIVVQYAKRVVGRRQYGGSSTHIPLKVNTGGVIPVIFASSILSFFSMAGPLFEVGTLPRRIIDQVAYGMPLYNLLYVVGIVFFAYFYTSIIFNPDDVAENMRKYGGFIPGIRPGKRTAEYLSL